MEEKPMIPKTGLRYDANTPIDEMFNTALGYLLNKVQNGGQEYLPVLKDCGQLANYLHREFADLFHQCYPEYKVKLSHSRSNKGVIHLVLYFFPVDTANPLVELVHTTVRWFSLNIGAIEVAPLLHSQMLISKVTKDTDSPAADLTINELSVEMKKELLKFAEMDISELSGPFSEYLGHMTTDGQTELAKCIEGLYPDDPEQGGRVRMIDLMSPEWRENLFQEYDKLQASIP
jgi:hypothetical protein